jgi:hypothetical protein
MEAPDAMQTRERTNIPVVIIPAFRLLNVSDKYQGPFEVAVAWRARV